MTSCDTSGNSPVGALLGNTAQKIVYWETISTQFIGKAVRCIALDNEDNPIIAVRESGVYISSSRGASWSDISTGLPEDIDIVSLQAATGNDLYAVSDSSAYRFSSSNEAWESFNQGLEGGSVLYGVTCTAAGRPFLTTSTGLYSLASDQSGWEKIISGLPVGAAITDVDFHSSGMSVAVTGEGEVFRSSDGTGGWVPVYLPFYLDSAFSVTQNPAGDLCLLLQSRRLAIYTDEGVVDITQQLYAEEIKFYNGIGFLQEVEELDNDPYSNDVGRYKMMRSVDGGRTWVPMFSGLQATVVDFVFDKNGNGYAIANGGVQRTKQPIK